MPELRPCIGLGGDGEQSAKGNTWRFEKENVGNNAVIIVAFCISQHVTYRSVSPFHRPLRPLGTIEV